MTSKTTCEKGLQAEITAAGYLENHGFTIITRNWRSTRGEIDIICKKDDCLIFVEVKSSTRHTDAMLRYRVNENKKHKIHLTALDYISRMDFTVSTMRFDVLLMRMSTRGEWHIEHIKDAFRVEDPP